jgi:hypothetical protein
MEIEALRNEVVVDLGCGGWSTWALTSSGKVYGWGKVHATSRFVVLIYCRFKEIDFRGQFWEFLI